MATPLALPLSASPQAPTAPSTLSKAPPAPPQDRSAVLPRDARLIALLLAANGAGDAEPAVMRILVEFAHRNSHARSLHPLCPGYTADILSDALVYAEHARGQPLNASAGAGLNLVPSIEDVRLAVQAKQESNSVPKEFLLDLATEINSNPLPPVPEVYGVRLPAPAQRLTAPNFSIVPRSDKGAVEPPQVGGLQGMGMGMGMGMGATGGGIGADEEDEEDGDGLFGSDDDENEEEGEEAPGPKANGEAAEQEEDDDDDDDEDEDEDEEMEEVGAYDNTASGGTAGEGDGDDDEDH